MMYGGAPVAGVPPGAIVQGRYAPGSGALAEMAPMAPFSPTLSTRSSFVQSASSPPHSPRMTAPIMPGSALPGSSPPMNASLGPMVMSRPSGSSPLPKSMPMPASMPVPWQQQMQQTAMRRTSSESAYSAPAVTSVGQTMVAPGAQSPTGVQTPTSTVQAAQGGNIVVVTAGNSPRDNLRGGVVASTSTLVPSSASTPRATPRGPVPVNAVRRSGTSGANSTTSSVSVSVCQLQAQRDDLPRFGAENDAANEAAKGKDEPASVAEAADRLLRARGSPASQNRGAINANADFRQAMHGLKKKKPTSSGPGNAAVTESMRKLSINNVPAHASSSSREAWAGRSSNTSPREGDLMQSSLSTSTILGAGTQNTSLVVHTVANDGTTDEESLVATQYGSEASQAQIDMRQISMASSACESPGTSRLISYASTEVLGSFGSNGGASLSALLRAPGLRNQLNVASTPPASSSRLNSPRGQGQKGKKRTWSPRPSRKGTENTESMPSLKAAALAAVQSGNPGLRTGILSGKISPRRLSPPGSPKPGSPRNSPPRGTEADGRDLLSQSARETLNASFQQYVGKTRRHSHEGYGSPKGSPRGSPRGRRSRDTMGSSTSERSLAAVAAKATGKVPREAVIEEAPSAPRQQDPIPEVRERRQSSGESDAGTSGRAAPPSPRDSFTHHRPSREPTLEPVRDESQAQSGCADTAGPAVKVWVRPPEAFQANDSLAATAGIWRSNLTASGTSPSGEVS